jgi:uroporphyrinogen-III synthase
MAEPEQAPLAGLTVLVTRPAGQAEGLCALIESAGGRALRLPLLEILPVEDNRPATELLNRRDYWDWLIFVSANAARFALTVSGWNARPSSRTRIAAVGEATAKALANAGVRVDLIPKPQSNSESLLASPELAHVAGQQILIVRGQGGREHLADGLTQRGATTAYAELYRRADPPPDAPARLAQWREDGIGAAVATSGEALAHLMELLGEAGAEFAYRTPLAVFGTRIAGLARERGWHRVAVADQANDHGLVQALIRLHRDGAAPPPVPGNLENSEQDLKTIH